MRSISLGSFGAPRKTLRRRASVKMRARSRPSSLHAGNPKSSWSSAASQRRSKFVSVTLFHCVSEVLDLELALRTRARMLHNARLFVSLFGRLLLISMGPADGSSAYFPLTIRPLRTLRSTNSAKNSVSGAQHSNGSQRSARPWPASTVISVIGSQAAASAPKKTVRLRAWRSSSISTGLSPAGCGKAAAAADASPINANPRARRLWPNASFAQTAQSATKAVSAEAPQALKSARPSEASMRAKASG